MMYHKIYKNSIKKTQKVPLFGNVTKIDKVVKKSKKEKKRAMKSKNWFYTNSKRKI